MAKKIIFEKKNVLVTGGAGFIGSHLCDRLVKNAKVICIDNFISGEQKFIDHLLRNPNFVFVKHDIVDSIELEEVPELERFDIKFQGIQEVYNLAAPMLPKDFENTRVENLLTNTVGIRNMLDIAVKYKAKFLQASTSVVYGQKLDDKFLFKEDYIGTIDQMSPRACYDLGKKVAETFVQTYSEVYGIDGRIARIFRTYGPRMQHQKGRLIPDFIDNALHDRDLIVYGDKEFSTSLIYVSDVVDAMVRLMDADNNPGPVNIGSDISVNLTNVCKKIIEMTNSKSSISYEKPLLFISELGLPDITKARKSIGWLPVVTLEHGLEKTIEYVKAEEALLKPY